MNIYAFKIQDPVPIAVAVSDTTAVSSLAAGCDILDHVKTQLPYALFCGAITIVAYIVMGLVAVS
jgi:Na+/H+ antiporter NhaC